MRLTLKLVLFLLAGTAFAIEDTPENRLREANRYLEATPPRELFADVADQVSKNAPPQQRDAIRAAFTKHLDIESFTKAMMDAMVKHFTADELKALADFYGSPIGKSAMKKFGVYMAEVMPAIQGEMLKVQAKINREMADQSK